MKSTHKVGSYWKCLKLYSFHSASAEVYRQDLCVRNADIPTAKQQFIISLAQSLMKLNPTTFFKPCTHLSILLFKFGFSAEQEKTKNFA